MQGKSEKKEYIRKFWLNDFMNEENKTKEETDKNKKEYENKSNKFSWDFLNKPLYVAIISATIGAILGGLFGYHIAISSIQYERQEDLIIGIFGSKEYFVVSGKEYRYNKLMISNPTQNKIVIETLYYKASNNWFEQLETKNITDGPSKINTPSLPLIDEPPVEITPYMEIPPNDNVPMKGEFRLLPRKTGTYYFQFCAITISKKEFCSKDVIILNVMDNLTLG